MVFLVISSSPLYVLSVLSCAIDGWQWSRLGSRFYLTPSVPRFNPGVMISKTGGGYRRYSLLPDFSVRL
ncbi:MULTISPECIES: hypothetical protein [Limnospira]|uniref:hypothetical protein n=1 Tax=Limnospira TaxID=2596745 RepID=UPI000315628A|nr:hypothetical protein [Limnospira maxima]QJB24407.1 hypothetical protein HFV01_16990 [Limnospira fusiformis SAG 85.79]